MIRHFTLIAFLSLIIQYLSGQDFQFKWSTGLPLHQNFYSIKIESYHSKSTIQIIETKSNDSIIKRLRKADCKLLINLIKDYDFPTRDSKVYGPITREFYKTKLLPDSIWTIINGDSLRREVALALGYKFDRESMSYYKETQSLNIWTDGNTYEGEYISNGISILFSVYGARLSSKDYELNKMIYGLMIKYNKKHDYKALRDLIESDKPGTNNNCTQHGQ